MRIAPFAMALAIAASPLVATAQDSIKVDEQIIIKQVQADRRAVYAQNMRLSDSESRAFWPIYDECELAMKIQKALPSVKALRFVQLQDRIDNIVAAETFSIIPIAR